MVEHSLHTRGVTSSNLVAGTKLDIEKGGQVTGRPFHSCCYDASTQSIKKAGNLLRKRVTTLLKKRVATAAAVIRCLCVEPAVVVIQNQVLAFVAHDV